MINKVNRNDARKKRALRSKNKVKGTDIKPRLSVFKSLNNIFVQIIDDNKGITLTSSSTIDKVLKTQVKEKLNSNALSAKVIGKDIADKAIKMNISTVVFDRNGYLYSGVIKTLADSAREAGLKF